MTLHARGSRLVEDERSSPRITAQPRLSRHDGRIERRPTQFIGPRRGDAEGNKQPDYFGRSEMSSLIQ